MKRGFLLAVTFLMALSLVLASCAPATPTAPTPTAPTPTAPTPTAPTPAAPTPTAPTGPETVNVTLTKVDGTKMEKTVEKPRYGGTIIVLRPDDVPNYDPSLHSIYQGTHNNTNEQMLSGNWAWGPAGTGEFDWLYTSSELYFRTGLLAETWEIPDSETFIFHFRKGVRYQNVPPLNGREMTASDVAFSFQLYFNMLPEYPNPKSRGFVGYTQQQLPKSITAPDKYTVVFKGDPSGMGTWIQLISGHVVIPEEIVPKAGQVWDWKRSVGPGPWILKDVVASSSWTYVRNPDYWQFDPIVQTNQLPYADSYKELLIRDVSTQMAAMRTGKVDLWREVTREYANTVLKDNPALKVVWKLGNPYWLQYRVDKPELPWYDIKVRQAMQMAIDREAIKQNLRGGMAEIFSYPVPNRSDQKALGQFMPLEELPPNLQELFQYKPDKAKQLLAEAGYPNGFTMNVVTRPDFVDQLAPVQADFAKVGINIVMDVKESGVYRSIRASFGHKEAVFENKSITPFRWGFFRPGQEDNLSLIDDEFINGKIAEHAKYFMLDDAKAGAVIRSIVPYVVEQAWRIQLPTEYEAMVWWPWLKNYSGENSVGASGYYFARWLWVDTALKKSMGY